MQYIVLDLEFNQAFDFKSNKKKLPLPTCRFEIIQIGAVKLNKKLRNIGEFELLIKPKIYPQIHPFVNKITGFSTSDFKNSDIFPNSFNEFHNFVKDKHHETIFCVWGNSDIRALYRNLKYYKLIDDPFIIKYIDLQEIATKYLKFSRGSSVGLKTAIEKLEIPINAPFHNALSDAIYTSEIFKVIKPKNPTIKIFNSLHIPKKE